MAALFKKKTMITLKPRAEKAEAAEIIVCPNCKREVSKAEAVC